MRVGVVRVISRSSRSSRSDLEPRQRLSHQYTTDLQRDRMEIETAWVSWFPIVQFSKLGSLLGSF